MTDEDKKLIARMRTPLAPIEGDWDRAADLIEALETQLKATLEREADTQRRHDAHIEALEARVAVVKPLEWFTAELGNNGYGKWKSEGYMVQKIEGLFLLSFDGESRSSWRFPTEASAKAAAQADYAARIMSAVGLVDAETIHAEAVAGAYAAAADHAEAYGVLDEDDMYDGIRWRNDLPIDIGRRIRSMTPSDAQAALARRDAETREKALREAVGRHRSFPDAADGLPMPPMAEELMIAGLSSEDARFVAIQLANNGLALIKEPHQ